MDGTEDGVASNQVSNQVEDIRLKLTSTQNVLLHSVRHHVQHRKLWMKLVLQTNITIDRDTLFH